MTFSLTDIPDLKGKVMIVTGGTNGIGLSSAIALASRGAHVIITARNARKGDVAVADIATRADNPSAIVEYGIMENSDLVSVKKFAQWFLDKNLPLHVLLLNAGVATHKPELIDGVDPIVLVNHLAHLLLVQLLLDKIKASAPSRIVFVSSLVHTFVLVPSSDWEAAMTRLSNPLIPGAEFLQYGYSKLYNLLTANYLAKMLGRDSGVYVNSIHPGTVSTGAWNHENTIVGYCLEQIAKVFFKSSDTGALPPLFAATHPDIENNKITGQYIIPYDRVALPSSIARNEAIQKQVWDVSNRLIKRILEQKEAVGDGGATWSGNQ